MLGSNRLFVFLDIYVARLILLEARELDFNVVVELGQRRTERFKHLMKRGITAPSCG
jgi:hypothetical protein